PAARRGGRREPRFPLSGTRSLASPPDQDKIEAIVELHDPVRRANRRPVARGTQALVAEAWDDILPGRHVLDQPSSALEPGQLVAHDEPRLVAVEMLKDPVR